MQGKRELRWYVDWKDDFKDDEVQELEEEDASERCRTSTSQLLISSGYTRPDHTESGTFVQHLSVIVEGDKGDSKDRPSWMCHQRLTAPPAVFARIERHNWILYQAAYESGRNISKDCVQY